ncbi:MAG: SDR family NAD(P)-dependent oxidoreductase [Paracoccaceae bacterium]|nr:SDR family NAD(P)-dependent oxidoreductase [Paracoccaceae bacterium]
MSRPETPTALVTGANRGIGLAIAEGLVRLGHVVTVGARDAEAGRAAALRLGCRWAHVDLTHPETYFAAVTEAGGFDVLVNNAGILSHVSLLDAESDFAEAMEVMVAAPLDLIRLCAPHWRETGWGRIVNLSSGWGAFSEGLGGPGAYGIAKAALNALTKALPRDLPPGVKVNAMCPGWVRTRMGGAGAPRSPEEGADTALWLATLPDDGPTGGFFRNRKPVSW